MLIIGVVHEQFFVTEQWFVTNSSWIELNWIQKKKKKKVLWKKSEILNKVNLQMGENWPRSTNCG